MLRLLQIGFACLLMGACTTVGTVEMRGQFESTAAHEVRYFLDGAYGYSTIDMALTPPRATPTVHSVTPNAAGGFESGAVDVFYHSPPLQPPPPVFWVGFSNERDVLYGVGPASGGVDFGTYDLNARAMVDRATGCWVIHSGTLTRPSNRSVVLSFVVAPNPTATGDCAERADPQQ